MVLGFPTHVTQEVNFYHEPKTFVNHTVQMEEEGSYIPLKSGRNLMRHDP